MHQIEFENSSKVNRYFKLIIFVLLFSCIIPGYLLRGLFADGSFYLFTILNKEDFALFEPARWMSHICQQWVVLLFMNLGVTNVDFLARIYSISLYLIPTIFIALSYVIIPKNRKEFFIFPLLFYLVGVAPAGFAAIAESQVAGAFFWFFLLFVVFCLGKRFYSFWMAAFSVMALGMHESYAVLSPVLIAAILVRNKGKLSYKKIIPIIILSISTVYEWYNFIVPRSIENKSKALPQIADFLFVYSYGHINTPVIFGILFLCLLIPVFLWKNIIIKKMSIIAFGLAAVANGIAPLMWEWSILPVQQFFARYFSVIMTIPLLVLLFLALRFRDIQTKLRRPIVVLYLLFLCIGQCGWHVSSTVLWQRYITWFRDVVRTNCGVLAFETTLMSENKADRIVIKKMTWGWTNPTMSLLLAQSGEITAVLQNPEGVEWEPFQIGRLGDLLNQRFFKINEKCI